MLHDWCWLYPLQSYRREQQSARSSTDQHLQMICSSAGNCTWCRAIVPASCWFAAAKYYLACHAGCGQQQQIPGPCYVLEWSYQVQRWLQTAYGWLANIQAAETRRRSIAEVWSGASATCCLSLCPWTPWYNMRDTMYKLHPVPWQVCW